MKINSTHNFPENVFPKNKVCLRLRRVGYVHTGIFIFGNEYRNFTVARNNVGQRSKVKALQFDGKGMILSCGERQVSLEAVISKVFTACQNKQGI